MNIKTLGVVLLIVFTTGCSFNSKNNVLDGEVFCRHTALSIASAAQENYPVRIAVGEWRGVKHVQPQIRLNGKWVYVGKTQNGHNLKIKKMNNFKVKGCVSLKTYFYVLTRGEFPSVDPDKK